jgi:hypothetical protein
MYWPVCLVCVCLCVLCLGVQRETKRHSREIREIVQALHTIAHTPWHTEITRTPLNCGGDERDADSLSLLIRRYIHIHPSVYVCLFAFLSIPDSCLPNSDSLSLLIQSFIPTRVLVGMCMYIFVLFCFVCVSIPCSWLSNSLFLLDSGFFICPTTSCWPCHRTSLPGLHRFSECACSSWLSTEILCLRHKYTGTQVCSFVCLLL